MLAVALLILGGALVAAGVGVLAGPGWALVAAGVGLLALGLDLARAGAPVVPVEQQAVEAARDDLPAIRAVETGDELTGRGTGS